MARHVLLRAHGAWSKTGIRGGDRGAAAVEFALVLPILIYLVFGIISFGYMLSFRQAMSQAAAEGGRAAAVAPSSTPDSERKAEALAAVNDALGNYGVTCTEAGALTHEGGPAGTCRIVARQTCSSGPTGAQCAVVELIYPYEGNPLIPGVGLNMFMPDDLTYETEVRIS
jgi:Flp pilus assembly protein TadG